METETLDLFESVPQSRETFGLVSDWIIKKIQEPGGVKCPLCKQHAQMYRRTITSTMARALILIYRYYEKHDAKKSIHLHGYFKRCRVSSSIYGDAPKLRFWNLLLKREETRPDGSTRNGHYWLTPDGKKFVEGNLTVAKYCRMYNDSIFGFEGPFIGIRDALKTRFNYDELMTGPVLAFTGEEIIPGE